MSTGHITSIVSRLVIGAICVVNFAACGGELLRTGRAPVYLVVTNITASAGGGTEESGFLLSDVQTLVDETVNGVTTKVATVFNDSAKVSLRMDLKNPSIDATPINSVTLTRYHVTFRRTDGRNTPGVDVPYGFDGGVSATIVADSSVEVAFEIVRHQSKLEPPLRNLIAGGGLGFISTIAEITFYGHDQNGNEVLATASIDVQFGDFGDKKS